MLKPTYNLQLTTYDRQNGFTLIEALVSAGLFAVAMSSMVGIFIAVQQINQTSAALQALQQNARFIGEDITKIVSNGRIDYARYGASVPQPYATRLYLIDKDGVQIRIEPSGNVLQITKGTATTNYNGREVSVLNFKAYIWPAFNPFPPGTTLGQPTVTIFIDLQSNINPRNPTRMQFQTTVATREYPP